MIQAKIIANSLSPQGKRITTFIITCPGFVLDKLKDNKMLSITVKDTSELSFEDILKEVEDNPFIPIAWQKERIELSGTEYMQSETSMFTWLKARDRAMSYAIILQDLGVAKQICNRLLEPFVYHTAIITSTEWESFLELNCPDYQFDSSYGMQHYKSKKEFLRFVGLPDCAENYSNYTASDWLKHNKGQSEIHMMELAECMWDAMRESVPNKLEAGAWHIPFNSIVNVTDRFTYMYYKKKGISVTSEGGYENPENWKRYMSKFYTPLLIKIATGMCSKASTPLIEEEYWYEGDAILHDKLLEENRTAAFEHCAQAMTDEEYYSSLKGTGFTHYGQYLGTNTVEAYMIETSLKFDDKRAGWCDNYRGFKSYRSML